MKCWMLSSQLTTVFEDSDYDSIMKTISIFICMNAPKKTGNAIVRYSLTPTHVSGNYPDRPSAYNTMKAAKQRAIRAEREVEQLKKEFQLLKEI